MTMYIWYFCFISEKLLSKSSILSDKEKKVFVNLLRNNGKFIGKSWNLIYKMSVDKNFKDQKYVKKIYEKKPNIMVIIETDNGNVIGGYTSTGWEGGNAWHKDQKAYIFGIRSNRGHEPGIYDIRKEYVDNAITSVNDWYFWFGGDVIALNASSGYVYHRNPFEYKSTPTDKHLLGGVNRAKIVDVEVFQIQE